MTKHIILVTFKHLNTKGDSMVTISWTAEQFEVKRVLLNSELTLARAIRHEAELLGLPVLMDNEETSPKVGDL